MVTMIDDTPVEDLVTSMEAASIIGINVNNFRQLVHKKRINVAYRKGRVALFHRADVNTLASMRANKNH